MKTAEQFRAEVTTRRGGRGRGGPHYTPEERAFAVHYGQQVLASGRSVSAAAEELGLCDKTLRDWLAKAEAKPARVGTALRAVVVKPSVPMAGSLTLLTPAGYRVAGLDVDSAAALLRRLG